MIPVPLWVAVLLIIIGAVAWLAEQPKKARQRREARDARARLSEDLTAPPPATQLPYGLTQPDENKP
jgi:Zn-dependent protease